MSALISGLNSYEYEAGKSGVPKIERLTKDALAKADMDAPAADADVSFWSR
jgi:hypothetical protein